MHDCDEAPACSLCHCMITNGLCWVFLHMCFEFCGLHQGLRKIHCMLPTQAWLGIDFLVLPAQKYLPRAVDEVCGTLQDKSVCMLLDGFWTFWPDLTCHLHQYILYVQCMHFFFKMRAPKIFIFLTRMRVDDTRWSTHRERAKEIGLKKTDLRYDNAHYPNTTTLFFTWLFPYFLVWNSLQHFHGAKQNATTVVSLLEYSSRLHFSTQFLAFCSPARCFKISF